MTHVVKDKNGFIEKADSAGTQGRGERGGGRRGGGGRGARGGGGGQSAPTEGSRAPSFELETLYPVQEEGEAKKSDKEPEYKSVSLKTFKDEKPVALIFGSYT